MTEELNTAVARKIITVAPHCMLSTNENKLIQAVSEALRNAYNDGYEASYKETQRLTKKLDIALNGDDAAEQASLCDIVSQVARVRRANDSLSDCGEDHEWVSMINKYIENGEMCLTCYQNGVEDIPVRPSSDVRKDLNDGK